MITYYGYTISPNQLETDEGFLICRNVPIARIGEQDYLGTELGLDTDKVVKVYRPEEEVFSEATIASFEGKPVTDDHPSDLLDAETATMHSKGHIQNVRRGAGEWKDYLVADLHIQDAELIREIRNGKREVSCGYAVEYVPNGDGTFSQKNIRGNHVAVVDQGRAGHAAAIMDSIKNKQATPPPERKEMSKKTLWSTLFGHAAEGKTADEISQMALDAAEALKDEAPAEEPAKEEEPAQDEDYKDRLFESIDALGSKIDRLCDALMPKEAEEEQKDEDPIEEALKTIEAAVGEKAEEETGAEATEIDEEEAHVVPAEELDECKDEEPAEAPAEGMDRAVVRAILTSMRPVVAGIRDEAQRKAVADALVKAVTPAKANDAQKIAGALPGMKAPTSGKPLDVDAVQNAYNQLNPHLRKERI